MIPADSGRPEEELGKLLSPPINEVICGVRFGTLPIDPIVVGAYWLRKRAEYPGHQIQPAISASPAMMERGFAVMPGLAHLRGWLISADEVFVMQIQHDRFYLNWRARGGRYPRFSGDGGILGRVIEEFDQFAVFCGEALGKKPEVSGVELGKVDLFQRGKHWNGMDDLRELLPILQSVLAFSEPDGDPIVALRFRDRFGTGDIGISIDRVLSFPAGASVPETAFKLETTVAEVIDVAAPDLRAAFRACNGVANVAFARLVPKEQRDKRFGRKEGED